MIRAHFNIRLDGAILPDRVGQCVADRAEARVAAARIVRGLVQRHAGEPRLLDAGIAVVDERGETLLELSFFEALYLPVAPVADPERIRPQAPSRREKLLSGAGIGAALAPIRRLADAVGARVQARTGN